MHLYCGFIIIGYVISGIYGLPGWSEPYPKASRLYPDTCALVGSWSMVCAGLSLDVQEERDIRWQGREGHKEKRWQISMITMTR